MPDFKAKMHQIFCRLGSAADPAYIVHILYTYIFCVIGPYPPTTKSYVPHPMHTHTHTHTSPSVTNSTHRNLWRQLPKSVNSWH